MRKRVGKLSLGGGSISPLPRVSLRILGGLSASISDETMGKSADRRLARSRGKPISLRSRDAEVQFGLSLREELTTMRTQHIVRAKLGADGKLRRVSPSGKTGKIVKAMVNPERLDDPPVFETDADSPILTRRELRELKRPASEETPDVAALRRKLRLSQGAFAMIFGIPLPTIKDWEQRRRKPDAPARAYLRVIAKNPDAVRNALDVLA